MANYGAGVRISWKIEKFEKEEVLNREKVTNKVV